MEFAIPGFIQNLCTPNALTTLMEYMVNYASPETFATCGKMVQQELDKIPEEARKTELLDRLQRIRETDARDLYF